MKNGWCSNLYFQTMALNGAVYDYDLTYPEFPGTLAGGAYTSVHREFRYNVLETISGMESEICRKTVTAHTNPANIDMSTLPTLDFARAFYDFDTDEVNGANATFVNVTLVATVDADTYLLGASLTFSAAAEFSVLTGTVGSPLPVTSTLFFTIDEFQGFTGQEYAGGYLVWKLRGDSPVLMSGSGDTGTVGAPIAATLVTAGTMTLDIPQPLPAATLNIATEDFIITVTGLQGRDGFFEMDMDVVQGAAVAAFWRVMIPAASSSTGTYNFRIPQLPAGAALDAMRIRAANDQVDVRLVFIDVLTGTFDQNDFTFSVLDHTLDAPYFPDLLAQYPDFAFTSYPDLTFKPQ